MGNHGHEMLPLCETDCLFVDRAGSCYTELSEWIDDSSLDGTESGPDTELELDTDEGGDTDTYVGNELPSGRSRLDVDAADKRHSGVVGGSSGG